MSKPLFAALTLFAVAATSCSNDSGEPPTVDENGDPGSSERVDAEAGEPVTRDEGDESQAARDEGGEAAVAAEPDVADPEAVVRELAEFYGGVDSLRVVSETVVEMTAAGQENRMTMTQSIAAARPNRLAVRHAEGMESVEYVSDGEQLITYVAQMQQYTEDEAPESFTSLMQQHPLLAAQGNGMAMFALHLLSDDPYETLMDGVTQTEYVGREELDGVTVHHLRFTQDLFDWDAWIRAEGDPLLMRVTMDMSKMFGQMGEQAGPLADMQMTMTETFRDWEINPELEEETFVFSPPEDAERVDSLFDFGGLGEPELSPLVGQPAPPVRLALLEGGSLDLASHAGRDIVMLDFWATWCSPCVAEMPHLAEVADEYRDRGVAFYAVNQGEEPEQIREFLEQEELDITVALDPEGTAGNDFGVQGIPMLVVIDKEGVVQTVHVGYSPDIKETLSQELDDLLAGKDLAAEALAAREQQAAEMEAKGLEEAWSLAGRFSGAAVDRETGLIYSIKGGTCVAFNAEGQEQSSFPVEHQVDTLRVAELTADSGAELLAFGTWGHTVVALTGEGAELWQETGGLGVDDAWPADLDGDGRDEVIVGYNGNYGLHVFDPEGARRWEYTDIGNVWHVAAGDVAGDDVPEVVTTSARGQVHLFDADGNLLADLDVPAYANMVRVGRLSPEDARDSILVVGSGDAAEQMIALDGEGTILWTLDLPAAVNHCDSLALADDRPWAAAGLRGGLVMVVDTTDGSVLAQAPGLGRAPHVAWRHAEGEEDPLLIVAGDRQLTAFHVTGPTE